jgi:hypothetical protein
MKFFSQYAMREPVAPAPPGKRERTEANLCAALRSKESFHMFFNSTEGRRLRGSEQHVLYPVQLKPSLVYKLCHGFWHDEGVVSAAAAAVATKKVYHRTAYQCSTCAGSDETTSGITLCRVPRNHGLDNGKYVSCWDLFHATSFSILSHERIVELNAVSGVDNVVVGSGDDSGREDE